MPLCVDPQRSDLLIFTNGHSRKGIAYLRLLAERSRFNMYFVSAQMLWRFTLQTWSQRPKKEILALVKRILDKKARRRRRQPFTGLRDVAHWWQEMLVSMLWTCYKNYLVSYSPPLIGVWNGTKFGDLALRLAAKPLQIPIVYFENGILPETTTLDDKGINAANSLPRDPQFYLARKTARAHLPKKWVDKADSLKQRAVPAASSPYLFAPFQVNRDSQILDHSKWIANMWHFFAVLQRILPRLKNKNLHLLIKQHPQCSYDYSALRKQANKEPRISFVEDDTESLIRQAEAVVTINSTVGIESLLLGKKVIALGDTYYNLPGLTQNASNEDQLTRAIDRLPTWRLNERLRASFLAYVLRYYCLPDDWRQPSERHFKAVDDRLASFRAGAPWLPL